MASSPAPEPEPGVREEDEGVDAGAGGVAVEEAGAGEENGMMSKKSGDFKSGEVGNSLVGAAHTETKSMADVKKTPPTAQSEEGEGEHPSLGDTDVKGGFDDLGVTGAGLESDDAQHALTTGADYMGEGQALPFHTTENQQRTDDIMDDSHGNSVQFELEHDKPAGNKGLVNDGYGGEVESAMLGATSEYSGGGYQADGGDGHGDDMGTQGSGGNNIEDDNFSGTRGRRMFDGSRVAEPDNVQIVDASDGADVIPGVDDLPIFANDQSKALNDEVKVSMCSLRHANCNYKSLPGYDIVVND